nr:hypothetical protein Itr_chr14CG12830 [Ipomoea trifida]
MEKIIISRSVVAAAASPPLPSICWTIRRDSRHCHPPFHVRSRGRRSPVRSEREEKKRRSSSRSLCARRDWPASHHSSPSICWKRRSLSFLVAGELRSPFATLHFEAGEREREERVQRVQLKEENNTRLELELK